MRVALLGAGAMGQHHARVIAESGQARLEVVVDADLERAGSLAERYGATASADPDDALRCDAAIVATPTPSHAALAKQLLESDVPLLVEKPLAASVADVRELVELSGRRGVPIMCGFVERFNPVVTTARGLLDGPIRHAVSVRHSPPAPRIGTGVVPDLLIHDLDLVTLAFGARVDAVSATAWRPDGSDWDEIVDCTLRFGGQGVAVLSADRHSQRKVRSLSLSTDTQLLELDLMRQDITVYRHVGHELLSPLTGYRAQTVVDIPFVRHAGEPLALQLAHFLELVSGRGDADAERNSLVAPHELAAEVEKQCTPT